MTSPVRPYRAYDKFNDDLFFSCNFKSNSLFFEEIEKREEGGNSIFLDESTGVYDKQGELIFVNDRLRFFSSPAHTCHTGNIWDATVIFEDGVYTVDILSAKQVKNPKDWDMQHDWVKSRSWACLVGYGEYGTWNVPRKCLADISTGFGSKHPEDFESYYKPMAEKYGYGKRYINALIIGNTHKGIKK
jgi:hypothetical protein